MTRLRSTFSVPRVTNEAIFAIDTDGPKSMTNDAEAVCEFLVQQYGNRRIIYRDTIGNWDEMVHENGRFIDFKPFREEVCL